MYYSCNMSYILLIPWKRTKDCNEIKFLKKISGEIKVNIYKIDKSKSMVFFFKLDTFSVFGYFHMPVFWMLQKFSTSFTMKNGLFCYKL